MPPAADFSSTLGLGLPSREELVRLRIWDIHFHLEPSSNRTLSQEMERLLPLIDRLGVERLCPFLHVGLGTSRQKAEFKDGYLQEVDDLLKRWPDRLLGFVWLNPNQLQESLAALDRWVRDGPMVGVKFGGGETGTLRCNHPNFDPIIRRAAELEAVVYIHTWLKVGGTPLRPGGDNNPGESTPQDVMDLSARYPRMPLLCGHAGGDWELGIRTIRRNPNVWLEIAGCDPTAGMVEMAARELGAERIIFGGHLPTRSYGTELSKVLGAGLTREQQMQALGGNLRRLLAPILKAKGIRH